MKSVAPELMAVLRGGASNTVYLCAIDHPTGMVRLNSGVLPVTWNSETYIALGKLGAIEGMTQSMDGRSQEVVLSMVAPLFDVNAQEIVSQPVRGRLAYVWQAFLNDDWSVISQPIELANITMDGLDIVVDESGLHVLQIKGYMTQFAARRVIPVYNSNETQLAEFASDTGYDRMAGLADKIV